MNCNQMLEHPWFTTESKFADKLDINMEQLGKHVSVRKSKRDIYEKDDDDVVDEK